MKLANSLHFNRKISHCRWKNILSISNRNFSDNDNLQTFRDILTFFKSNGLISNVDFRTQFYKQSALLQIKECPMCKPHHNQPDNQWKLGIFPDNGGAYNCFRCQNTGNWEKLKYIFERYGFNQSSTNRYFDGYDYDELSYAEQQEQNEMDIFTMIELMDNNYKMEQDWEITHAPIDKNVIECYNRLREDQCVIHRINYYRKISKKTLDIYNVGMQYYKIDPKQSHGEQFITFPMYQLIDDQFKCTKMKLRPTNSSHKKFVQWPMEGKTGIFGLTNNNKKKLQNKKSLIITEGEYDAMAICEDLKQDSMPLSLPNGANPGKISQFNYTLNDDLEKVFVWMDFDESGTKGANALKDLLCTDCKIDEKKITVIKEDEVQHVLNINNNDKVPKDANDILIAFGTGSIQKVANHYGM